jgi:phosphate transport system permease protein
MDRPGFLAPASLQLSRAERWLNRGFWGLTLLMAIATGALIGAIAITVAGAAWPAVQEYGLSFLVTSQWNAVAGRESFGILFAILGTLLTAGLAVLIAGPIGLGAAIALSEEGLPLSLRRSLSLLVELLAAVPSVVYGLWGLVVLIPWLQPWMVALHRHWGWIPLFSTSPLGPGVLPAALVLAIMILPILVALARETLLALPSHLREGALALGATRWEALIYILLPAARTGLAGGVLLALGRALGETMAVTMVIGNANRLSPSLLAPGNTISALLANQFASARGLHVAALMYAALVLMGLTLTVNLLAVSLLKGKKAK